jgi:RNA-directed DNA polymerase
MKPKPPVQRLARKRSIEAAGYAIDQCALYKLRSKGRLARLLGFDLRRLQELGCCGANYKRFKLPQTVCPFIGRVIKERWVQEPKAELRAIHDRLRKLISRVAPPTYAHGAIIGRSYRSNAATHVNATRAATFDIKSFYQKTRADRIFEFYSKKLLCSADVSRLLTRLSCIDDALPTGSPLSPILSLYANQPMFDGLDKLARNHRLTFTCYIDDLAFSGSSIAPDIARLVREIVINSGHTLSDGKTKFFNRKHAKHITGVVLKDGKLKVPHTRFLKARAISSAIAHEIGANRIGLQRKLAGLLAEAAHLDGAFKKWSQKAQYDLQGLVAAASA